MLHNLLDKIGSSVVAFRHAAKSSPMRHLSILLSHRANHEKYFSVAFGILGGKAKVENLGITHAIIRKMKEKTGLNNIEITTQL